jgi:hypothetical protein
MLVELSTFKGPPKPPGKHKKSSQAGLTPIQPYYYCTQRGKKITVDLDKDVPRNAIFASTDTLRR